MLFNVKFKNWHYFYVSLQNVTKKRKFTVSRPTLVKQWSAPPLDDFYFVSGNLSLTSLLTLRGYKDKPTNSKEHHNCP